MPAKQKAEGLFGQLQAAGDLIIAFAAGIPSRLGIGSAGDVLTVSSGTAAWQGAARAFSSASSNNPSLSVTEATATWTDLPGTSQSFTPKSASRQIKVMLTFSGYDGGPTSTQLQCRIAFGGTPTQAGSTYNVFFNAPISGANATHLNFAFQWVLAAATFGSVGTPVTVKAQAFSPNPGGARFQMDSNDHSDMVIEEIG